MCLPTIRRFGARSFDLRLPNMRSKKRDDHSHGLILDCKDVFEPCDHSARPSGEPGRSIDQLRGDAKGVAAPLHTAFQYVAHAKFAADLADIDRLALVLEAGLAGDYEQPAEARSRRADGRTSSPARVVDTRQRSCLLLI